MHGREQWVNLVTQTHTARQKDITYKDLCALVCEWKPVDKVCVRLSMEATFYISDNAAGMLPLSSPFFQPFRLPVFISSCFSHSFLLKTRDTSSIFIVLPQPTNAIWAKNRKTDKKTEKKSEIIDLMSASIRERRGEEEQRKIEEREETDWKWAVGITQVKLMEKQKK